MVIQIGLCEFDRIQIYNQKDRHTVTQTEVINTFENGLVNVKLQPLYIL